MLVIQENTISIMKNQTNEITEYTPIYSSLFEDVAKERMAPLRDTLNIFTKKAGYKVVDDEKYNAKSIVSETFLPIDTRLNYDKIKNITSDELDDITTKKIEGTITADEKLQVKKFFFRNLFLRDTPEDDIRKYWDNFTLVSKIDKLSGNELLSKIKTFNNWECVLPDDKQFNSAKLSDELKDEIFANYKFRYLNTASKDTKILYNVYKLEFGEIIRSVTKDKKNYSYKISKKARDIYESCVKCLRSYKLQEVNNIFPDEDIFIDDVNYNTEALDEILN